MADDRYYVYQNLNDSTDVIVLDGEQVSIGIYQLAGGPFSTKEEAERRADELRKGRSAD